MKTALEFITLKRLSDFETIDQRESVHKIAEWCAEYAEYVGREIMLENEIKFDFTRLKTKRKEDIIGSSTYNFLSNIEHWETLSDEESDKLIQLVKQNSVNPESSSNSFHLSVDRYLINGETYRFVYEISGMNPPMVEKLIKKKWKQQKNLHQNI